MAPQFKTTPPPPSGRSPGRPPGSPNKQTLMRFADRRSVIDICSAEHGKTPVEVLAETMRLRYGFAASYQKQNAQAIENNSQHHIDRLTQLLDAACEPAVVLMEYRYAKLKRIDHTGVIGLEQVADDDEQQPVTIEHQADERPPGRTVVFKLKLDGARPSEARSKTNGHAGNGQAPDDDVT